MGSRTMDMHPRMPAMHLNPRQSWADRNDSAFSEGGRDPFSRQIFPVDKQTDRLIEKGEQVRTHSRGL